MNGFRDPTTTNTHTYFFREPLAMEMVARRYFSRRDKLSSIGVWCAGSSSGEEPYSLAILASELGADVELVATDINPGALRAVTRGEYSSHALRYVTAERRQRFFSAAGDRFRVADSVRSLISVLPHDVTTQLPPRPQRSAGWDVVFCRNVLIYYDANSVRAALSNIASVLAPDGVLVLGACEWVGAKVQGQISAASALQIAQMDDVFVYRRYRPGERPATASISGSASASVGAAATFTSRTPGSLPTAAGAIASGASTRGPARSEPPSLGVLGVSTQARQREVGDQLLNAGRGDEALAAYEEAVKLDPCAPDLHLRVAVCHLRSGRNNEAKEALRRTLFLDAGIWPAALMLGDLLTDEDPQAAVRYYQQARESLQRSANDRKAAPLADDVLAPFFAARQVALEAIQIRLAVATVRTSVD